MEAPMMILAVFLFFSDGSIAAKRCGEVEIAFLNRVVTTEADADPFALLELRNQSCNPKAFELRGSRKDGYWLRNDELLRWENQVPASKQWISQIGTNHLGRPSGYPNREEVILRPGESVQVFAELPHDYARLPSGTKIRVFVTDNLGTSRSSLVLTILPLIRHPEFLAGRKFDREGD